MKRQERSISGVRFNRNIVECKFDGMVSTIGDTYDLIET